MTTCCRSKNEIFESARTGTVDQRDVPPELKNMPAKPADNQGMDGDEI